MLTGEVGVFPGSYVRALSKGLAVEDSAPTPVVPGNRVISALTNHVELLSSSLISERFHARCID